MHFFLNKKKKEKYESICSEARKLLLYALQTGLVATFSLIFKQNCGKRVHLNSCFSTCNFQEVLYSFSKTNVLHLHSTRLLKPISTHWSFAVSPHFNINLSTGCF